MTAKEIIKEMMSQRGWSEKTLAVESGYAVGAIASYLHYRENYRIGTFHRLITSMGGVLIFRLSDDNVIDMEEETEKTAIQRMRRQKGWTLKDLADAAGYKSHTNIASLLSGKTSMRSDAAIRLVNAMRGEIVVVDDGKEYILGGE